MLVLLLTKKPNFNWSLTNECIRVDNILFRIFSWRCFSNGSTSSSSSSSSLFCTFLLFVFFDCRKKYRCQRSTINVQSGFWDEFFFIFTYSSFIQINRSIKSFRHHQFAYSFNIWYNIILFLLPLFSIFYLISTIYPCFRSFISNLVRIFCRSWIFIDYIEQKSATTMVSMNNIFIIDKAKEKRKWMMVCGIIAWTIFILE